MSKNTRNAHRAHRIPPWTFIATPLSLALMILTPWDKWAKQNPDANFLILGALSIGMALVLISIVHWLKGAKG